MNDKEQKIFDGLAAIGFEVATFFRDAVAISKMDIDSKPYLLSHLAREIESGLRDVLVPKEETEKLICTGCAQPINRKIGHKVSILKALGIDEENEFAKKWYKTAKEFPGFAHRSGAWKDPREKNSFNSNWSNFIDVLEYLVGNYYSISDSLDSLIKGDAPSKEVINTLPNLLKQNARNVYFFTHLTNSKWLKPLKDGGFFNADLNPSPVQDENNPGFYGMPFWFSMSYLEKVSADNFNNPDTETTKVLLKIVDEITNYKDAGGQRIENYRTDYSIFKIICSLPKGSLLESHIGFIKEALLTPWHGLIGYEFNLVVERVIKEENINLIRKTLEVLFSYKVSEDQNYDSIKSIFQSYELRSILDKHKTELIKISGDEFLNIVVKIVEQTEKIDASIFSIVKIPAIEDHNQTAFPEEFGCQIVYALRDCLLLLPKVSVVDFLKNSIEKRSSIFKRIAIFIINHRYEEFKDIFWSQTENPFLDTTCKHELYELLKNRGVAFSGEEMNKVLEWIKSIEPFKNEHPKKDEEFLKKNLAYRKKEWLTSLEGTKNASALKLLEEQNLIYSEDIRHPGFSTWSSGIMIGNRSPLSVEELQTMELKEIIIFYDNFKPNKDDFMGPSKDGIIDALVISVKADPEKYSKNCESIIEAKPELQNAWLRGLNDAWRIDNKEFDETCALKVLNEILNKEGFWNDANENQQKDWLTSTILSFIGDGLRAKGYEFKIKNLDLVKCILFTINKNEKSKINDFRDLSMTSVNSVKGKLYSCLIEYSLWNSRNLPESTETTGVWDNEVKALFTELISKNDDNVLLFHILGQYLFNIAHLDKSWLIENFSKIFPIDNEKSWSAAMDGHFYYNESPIKFIFDLFVNGKHFELILKKEPKSINGNSKQHIVNCICIAYLRDYDLAQLNGDLMKMLLETKTEYVYSNLIFFFWDTRHRIPAEYINKVRAIWEYLYADCIQLKSQKIDEMLLSGSCKWLNTIDKIDDKIYEIVKNSIPFLNGADKHFALEGLNKHVKVSTKYVAELTLLIFSKEVTYDTRGRVTSIVETLYENGEKEIADKICLLHGEKGFDFLKAIYKKYNS